MNTKPVINEKVSVLIVKLCFRINELKYMSMDEPTPHALLFAYIYNTVKNGLDVVLGAVGLNGMLKEVERPRILSKIH